MAPGAPSGDTAAVILCQPLLECPPRARHRAGPGQAWQHPGASGQHSSRCHEKKAGSRISLASPGPRDLPSPRWVLHGRTEACNPLSQSSPEESPSEEAHPPGEEGPELPSQGLSPPPPAGGDVPLSTGLAASPPGAQTPPPGPSRESLAPSPASPPGGPRTPDTSPRRPDAPGCLVSPPAPGPPSPGHNFPKTRQSSPGPCLWGGLLSGGLQTKTAVLLGGRKRRTGWVRGSSRRALPGWCPRVLAPRPAGVAPLGARARGCGWVMGGGSPAAVSPCSEPEGGGCLRGAPPGPGAPPPSSQVRRARPGRGGGARGRRRPPRAPRRLRDAGSYSPRPLSLLRRRPRSPWLGLGSGAAGSIRSQLRPGPGGTSSPGSGGGGAARPRGFARTAGRAGRGARRAPCCPPRERGSGLPGVRPPRRPERASGWRRRIPEPRPRRPGAPLLLLFLTPPSSHPNLGAAGELGAARAAPAGPRWKEEGRGRS